MKIQITFLMILSVLFSCRPTVLLQSGTTKFKNNESFNRVMIIAYTGMLKDPETFESAGVNAFSSKDISVLSLQKLMAEESASIKTDQEKRLDLLTSNQIDAVIEIRFISMRQEASSSESQYPTRREYRIMDDTHYTQLIQEYGKREEKGSIYEDVKVKMDVRLLKLIDNEYQVVWSARTESNNPKHNKAIANGCINTAKKAMKKEGLI